MALCTRSALPGGLAVAGFVVHVVSGMWLNPMHEGLLGGQVALDASPLPGSPSTRVTGGVIGIRPIPPFYTRECIDMIVVVAYWLERVKIARAACPARRLAGWLASLARALAGPIA